MSMYKRKRSSRIRRKNDEENVNINRRQQTVLRYRDFIVPDHFFTHMKYAEQSVFIVPAAVSGAYVYAGNDIFDPNVTGTGHQPMGFDQLMALYKRFRVHSSRITVELVYQTTGFMYSVTPSQSSTTPTNFNDSEESPYAKWIVAFSGVGYRVKVENDISTIEITGIQSISQDDQFAGTSTASPGRLWYWVIHGQSYDGVATGSLRVNVCLEYDVELYDRVNLGQS